MGALACPIDLLALSSDGATWRCESGHAYDIAKDGYVNLLPPGKPSRQKSGDDLESIHARRRFLDAGHYAPLRSHVGRISDSLFAGEVLDVGCGEGYYTAGLAGRQVYGVDLSRSGVRLGARRYKDIVFAVANAMALPVADGSVDLAVSVFSPVIPDEFARVVGSGKHVVIAIPGARHLEAVRGLLYETPQPHDEAMPLTNDARFSLVDTERISAVITLDAATLGDLLTMTPYRFAVPPEAIDRARAAETPLDTPIEFVVSRFVRN